MTEKQLLLQESMSQDIIVVKAQYVRMCNDLISGLMLSQIVYWWTPSKNGKSKLRVKKDGKMWIAKTHKSWTEYCITEKQASRHLKILVNLGLIEMKNFKFDGEHTTHIHLIESVFKTLILSDLDNFETDKTDISKRTKQTFPKGQNRHFQKDKMDISITETTTETTTKTKAELFAPQATSMESIPQHRGIATRKNWTPIQKQSSIAFWNAVGGKKEGIEVTGKLFWKVSEVAKNLGLQYQNIDSIRRIGERHAKIIGAVRFRDPYEWIDIVKTMSLAENEEIYFEVLELALNDKFNKTFVSPRDFHRNWNKLIQLKPKDILGLAKLQNQTIETAENDPHSIDNVIQGLLGNDSKRDG